MRVKSLGLILSLKGLKFRRGGVEGCGFTTIAQS